MTATFKTAYTAPEQNANNEPYLNVMGMRVGVKISHSQTYGQFSCVEAALNPKQMGPPPHIHYALDEIMYVIESYFYNDIEQMIKDDKMAKEIFMN